MKHEQPAPPDPTRATPTPTHYTTRPLQEHAARATHGLAASPYHTESFVLLLLARACARTGLNFPPARPTFGTKQ